jgi:uncharacterized protein YcfL
MAHTITDPSLSDSVVPVFYNKGRTGAGFTIVQLAVQNQTRTVTRVNYRVEWKDENGMLISSGNISKPLVIEAGARVTIKEVAPTPNAVDASISFQESQNN